MNDQGELGAPTIYNGVMYVVNGKWTFALDVETGRQIWRTPVRLESGIQRSAFHRGAATIYNGKLFRVTIDNHILALDMKTGEELWNQKFADLHDGYYATAGPIIANGVLISGVAGGESTTRGFLTAGIPTPGRNCGADTPFRRRANLVPRRGQRIATPGARAEVRHGAPVHTIPNSIWSIGGLAMPSHTIPDPARVWTACTRTACWQSGRRPVKLPAIFNTRQTTYSMWMPQTSKCWPISGWPASLGKVMIQANKNGFLYVLDRTTCKLIAAHPYVRVNWATSIDTATGRPVLTDLQQRFLGGEEVEIWPSRGTNATPVAFDPKTGLIYASTWNIPRIQKLDKAATSDPWWKHRPASSPGSGHQTR